MGVGGDAPVHGGPWTRSMSRRAGILAGVLGSAGPVTGDVVRFSLYHRLLAWMPLASGIPLPRSQGQTADPARWAGGRLAGLFSQAVTG